MNYYVFLDTYMSRLGIMYACSDAHMCLLGYFLIGKCLFLHKHLATCGKRADDLKVAELYQKLKLV